LGSLGVFILWFGWFGFNPGSTLSGTDERIGLIAVTTNLAAAAAATTVMLLTWFRYGKPDVSMTLNGVLGGLVAITAGCAAVSPLGSVAIGCIAGVVLTYAIEFIEKVARIDDPVGAVGVHGACGALGTLLVGVFSLDGGLLYGGGVKLLATQMLGVVTVAIWTLCSTFILFRTLKATIGLRVPASEELDGLDRSEHRVDAYGDFVLKPIPSSK
jgi:Amt family ammonium transporter